MKQRIERMEKLVRMYVASTISKSLPSRHVTLQQIDVSPDMRHAVVWVSAFDDEKSDLLEDISEIRPEIQAELARNLKTKFIPRLHFRYYSGSNHAKSIESLLNSL